MSMLIRRSGLNGLLAISVWLGVASIAYAQSRALEVDLLQWTSQELAMQARDLGDPVRGAVVFFQPQMGCSKCHTAANDANSLLGPDLTKLGEDCTDESLVDSILQPSKVIRKGFESVTVVTADGNAVSGLLVDRNRDRTVIREASGGGQLTTIIESDIEQFKWNDVSIMPSGQVNQLNSRQQFLDLIRYLMEIREGGAERAKQLQPAASLLAFHLPEYEQKLDHAALIQSWNAESLKRGEAIYLRVCANCHGTKDQLGSLPTSLRFASGKFKNGCDPLSMYRTMTHGFGLMVPQTWMVPVQKYDVIHYIRESYLKPFNPTQFTVVDTEYLNSLPQGDSLGPAPSTIEAWSAMDYGPSLTHTFEVPGKKENFAYKGIAIRLNPGGGGISRGQQWMVFDTDTLRMAAGWVSGSDEPNRQEQHFTDWRSIQFNGEHGVHPKIVGRQIFANSTGPGWANPDAGNLQDDQRIIGRDGKRYGPLPRQWGRFQGMYHFDQHVVLSYSVGSTAVLESPGILPTANSESSDTMLRRFTVGARDRDLVLQVAEQATDEVILEPVGESDSSVIRYSTIASKQTSLDTNEISMVAGFAPSDAKLRWELLEGKLVLRIFAGAEPVHFAVWIPVTRSPHAQDNVVTDGPDRSEQQAPELEIPFISNADLDLTHWTNGGPPRWPQVLTTTMVRGADDGPFAADMLTPPDSNPWLAQLRFTGLDFFPDGRIAVCTWDGDVWIVTPEVRSLETSQETKLSWQRIASGLFQPLGLKIVGEKIHLICRDQLAVLHDLNQDGEIDFYECLNNDHQVTEHFHEFAMGLQTDLDGNFYYAKSGCHGKPAVVPHHGTLLRVSPDGNTTEILANGFRAANGVCLNPDGSFFVTDQEGFWNPKNRINWVTVGESNRPKFYGNMLGYHDVSDPSDAAMVPPLCWITNAFDRSPAELLWVSSDRWGPLKGSLLNLSYGYGRVFLVPHEQIEGQMQGGMIALPIPDFPTGVMRGRFHPQDGQLYLCGMFAWAGNATHPGGLYRLRATGKPIQLPVELKAIESGIQLRFSEPLDPRSLAVDDFHIKTWSLKRTANYGSDHYDEKPLAIRQVVLSSDGKTVLLEIDDLRPTWCMEIRYDLKFQSGSEVQGTIHNTIHSLGN